jgi:hypothetical protein
MLVNPKYKLDKPNATKGMRVEIILFVYLHADLNLQKQEIILRNLQ